MNICAMQNVRFIQDRRHSPQRESILSRSGFYAHGVRTRNWGSAYVQLDLKKGEL